MQRRNESTSATHFFFAQTISRNTQGKSARRLRCELYPDTSHVAANWILLLCTKFFHTFFSVDLILNVVTLTTLKDL